MALHKMGVQLNGSRVLLVLTEGKEELLRASLSLPVHPLQDKPLPAVLEGLALWLETTLLVVLSADEPSDGFFLGLTDERGGGHRTPYYDVTVVERPRTVSTLKAAAFKDVRQLCLFERRRPRSRR
jgi:hypothetical protein